MASLLVFCTWTSAPPSAPLRMRSKYRSRSALAIGAAPSAAPSNDTNVIVTSPASGTPNSTRSWGINGSPFSF
eukprot:1182554-Prorocentrum_minimum.AAC.3